ALFRLPPQLGPDADARHPEHYHRLHGRIPGADAASDVLSADRQREGESRTRTRAPAGDTWTASLAAGDLPVSSWRHLAPVVQHAIPLDVRCGPGARVGHASLLRL